jgi:DNA-binding response OmpR family regulator
MVKKILVVDDEPAIVKMLESRLRNRGYEVTVASDGKSCLKKAIEERPDLILLDIVMPELNGFEVTKRLKQNANTKDIPVIMLTVLAERSDVSKGLEEGARCFITKPFNAADLLLEIDAALSAGA